MISQALTAPPCVSAEERRGAGNGGRDGSLLTLGYLTWDDELGGAPDVIGFLTCIFGKV